MVKVQPIRLARCPPRGAPAHDGKKGVADRPKEQQQDGHACHRGVSRHENNPKPS